MIFDLDQFFGDLEQLWTQPFVDSAAALEAAAGKGEAAKKAEFRRFVEEFGTHFATQAFDNLWKKEWIVKCIYRSHVKFYRRRCWG